MVQLQLHYEHPACNIFYNLDLHAVHTVWKGPKVKGDTLKTILNDLLALLIEKKTNGLMADVRLMKVIDREDQEWIVKDWYPRAVATGFNCEALIVSKATYNETTIKQIVNRIDDKIMNSAYFETYNEAVLWIKQYLKEDVA